MTPRSRKDQWQNQSLKNQTEGQSFKAGKGQDAKKSWHVCGGSRFTLQGEGTGSSFVPEWPEVGGCLQWSSKYRFLNQIPKLCFYLHLLLGFLRGLYDRGDTKICALTPGLIALCFHWRLPCSTMFWNYTFQDPLSAVFHVGSANGKHLQENRRWEEERSNSLLILFCSESIFGSNGDKDVDNGSESSGRSSSR